MLLRQCSYTVRPRPWLYIRRLHLLSLMRRLALALDTHGSMATGIMLDLGDSGVRATGHHLHMADRIGQRRAITGIDTTAMTGAAIARGTTDPVTETITNATTGMAITTTASADSRFTN